MKNKILLSIALAFALVGCQKTVKEVPPQDFVIVHPDSTPALNLHKIDWEVWNRQKLADESVRPENRDRVFYVLTPEMASKLFENLINVSDFVSKSVENNQFYRKSVDDYRAGKLDAIEASKDGK